MQALAPGDRGIDYSDARPQPPSILANGGKFAMRYSAGAASDPANSSHKLNAPKLITPAEFKALVEIGLDVIALDEWYATRITEGANAGAEDAAAAGALWESCGLNRGASIFFAMDENAPPSQWPAADAYLTAANKELGGHYLADCYGPDPYLLHTRQRGLIRYGYRAMAESWSSSDLPWQPATLTQAQRNALVVSAIKATPAHLWQTGNRWYGNGADEALIVQTPVGSHLENAPRPVPPPPPRPAGFVYPTDAARALFDAAELIRSALLPGYVPAEAALVEHFGPITGQNLLGRTRNLEQAVAALAAKLSSTP